MARWFGVVVVAFWLAAMSALFYRDIWPHWAAGDPPQQMPDPNAEGENRQFQSGIHSKRGRVGTSWVRFYDREDTMLIHSQTVLDGLPLLPPLLVDSELTYARDGKLDTLKIQITGAPLRLEFNGENYGMDFSCELITGPGPNDRLGFKLDATAAATMSEALRPFTLLKGLFVGKTWRIRLINPLPVLRGEDAEFEAYLVRVTAREAIEHRGQTAECFRIESRGLRAWANDEGRVLLQEVRLPLFGVLSIRQEPYDDRARLAAVTRVRGTRQHSEETPRDDESHDTGEDAHNDVDTN